MRDGIRLRVVGLNPNPGDREFWTRQLGEDAFVPEPVLARDPARERKAHLIGSFPRALVLLGILLAVALAANELWGNAFTLGHEAHGRRDIAVARERHLRRTCSHLSDSLRRCEPDQVQRDSLSLAIGIDDWHPGQRRKLQLPAGSW